MIHNSKGKIYYGMHFYPGVAEYQEPGKDAFRVFLNEDTIRSMDPTFAGRPIYVEHVDEVPQQPGSLVDREADGYVIESFYNSADGKHWVKFIIVSESGERAIKNGLRLSNAYIPTQFGKGGLWNGVEYAKEITGGEYEHLAIVKNPRYEESVIMTPEEFKQYNEDKLVELKRLSNSKEKGDSKMKLNFFKRAKVENSIDLAEMSVVLPKSGKEIAIIKLVNDADEMEEAKKKNEVMADMGHKVKMHDGSMCNVGELLEKHKAMCDEMESMKKENEDSEIEEGEKEVGDRGGDESLDNDEDEEAKKKALELAEHEEKEIEAAKKKNSADDEKKKVAKEKADRLKNAHLRDAAEETVTLEFSGDRVARGKSRYGSN